MSNRPPCVGTFEKGDPECEGSKPCTWRDKCEAFKLHLKKAGQDVVEWIDPETNGLLKLDEERFNDWLLELSHERAARSKRAKKASKKKASKKAKAAPPKAEPEIVFAPIVKQFKGGAARHPKGRGKGTGTNSRWAAKKKEDVARLLDHFIESFVEALPKRFKWASGEQAALPGDLYLVDRVKPSGYLSIYRRRAQGWDTPIVAAYIKPWSCTFEARLGLSPSKFKSGLVNGTERDYLGDVEAFKKGAFVSRVCEVGYPEATTLARALARMVKDGRISSL